MGSGASKSAVGISRRSTFAPGDRDRGLPTVAVTQRASPAHDLPSASENARSPTAQPDPTSPSYYDGVSGREGSATPGKAFSNGNGYLKLYSKLVVYVKISPSFNHFNVQGVDK